MVTHDNATIAQSWKTRNTI